MQHVQSEVDVDCPVHRNLLPKYFYSVLRVPRLFFPCSCSKCGLIPFMGALKYCSDIFRKLERLEYGF